MATRSSGYLWMVLILQLSSRAASFLRSSSPRLLFRSRRFLVRSNMSNTTADDILLGRIQVSIPDAIKVHGEPDVVFVDGSWWLASRDTTSRQDYENSARIKGARFFDIDDICAKGKDQNPKNLPHMMPPAKLFAAAMDAMKIRNQDHIIVYGQDNCPFLHRAWYQLSAFHDVERVHLLEGSIAAWKAAGGPIDDDEKPIKAILAQDLDLTKQTTYQAITEARQVVDMEEMKRIVSSDKDNNNKNNDAIIVDARSPERFYAQVDEPRPGLRLGHMPGAKNLFFMTLLDPNDNTRLKPKEELLKLIQEAGIDLDTDKQIIVSCGSGASACTVAVAMIHCGRDPSQTYIYDGSWCEWGADPDTPIVKED